MSCGSSQSFEWLQDQSEHKFDPNTQVLGHEDPALREGTILNRIVRATAHRFEIETDPMHVELIVETLNLN